MLIVSNLTKAIFGSRNQRLIKRLYKVVAKINTFEAACEKLTDAQLREKIVEFRNRIANGATLESLIPETFAVVREASKRALGMRHFDVQMIGGIVLHNGKIAEMCTGEGKTLASTLPAYLNALSGKGVHIVTVNDYLAKRDAQWMGPIYEFLGLTVGVNLPDMSVDDKRAAYAADVTYGTNNEFGFDYLRDNMAFSIEEKVQRELHYAIIDEVDSILIDEARTPLIISGPTDENSELYIKINKIIPKLTKRDGEEGPGDYYLEEKHKQAYLTEEGHARIEKLMIKDGVLKDGENLYDPSNIKLMHYVTAALRAYTLFSRDVDYLVSNGEVVIVDEHTGRAMVGRRWSDGLHQAVEAKEGVKIQNENQTLATITFQNYFRLYNKLSGMTGTADTEAYELHQIYSLEVVVVPTNMPLIRKDHSDKVYLTTQEKFKAVVSEIKECVDRGQPVLVGTASIENSEYLSKLLTKEKIKHSVLNAKFHEQEAQIIAQAGKQGAITIATNMAGRGTDIVLGGSLDMEISNLENPDEKQIEQLKQQWQQCHDEVVNSGGLHVLGSERHESRRIDNQLRGRSGRQGDSGSSRFYVSLQDNLMRIFASDRMASIMRRLGMKDGDAIEHSMVSKAIESAQRKVESFNFDIRKQLLEYDDIANDQRKVIYQQRNEPMGLDDISETIQSIYSNVIDRVIDQYILPQSMEEQWDVPGLQQLLKSEFMLELPIVKMVEDDSKLHEEDIRDFINKKFMEIYNQKEELVGNDVMRQFEKSVMLQCLDSHWKEHLATMDHLRHSIHLSGYAQKDPKQEYKKEAFSLFSNMLVNIKHEVIQILSTVQIEQPEDVGAAEQERQRAAANQTINYYHNEPQSELAEIAQPEEVSAEGQVAKVTTVRREGPKVGRNDPCPCGSGKKYKHCHGKL